MNLAPRYLRVADVARLLDLHQTTVRKLIATQQLPAKFFGRNIRVDPGDLEAWVAGGGCAPGSWRTSKSDADGE